VSAAEPEAVAAGARSLSERYGRLGILARGVVYNHPSPSDLSATVLAAALPQLGAHWEAELLNKGKLIVSRELLVEAQRGLLTHCKGWDAESIITSILSSAPFSGPQEQAAKHPIPPIPDVIVPAGDAGIVIEGIMLRNLGFAADAELQVLAKIAGEWQVVIVAGADGSGGHAVKQAEPPIRLLL
jgi:hypothetical protein